MLHMNKTKSLKHKHTDKHTQRDNQQLI
jgi:hypothetical protein